MYAYIKGMLAGVDTDGIVVENGGMGYNIKMTPDQLQSLPSIGSEVKIYTYTSVREDALWLYGFFTQDELNMFKLLITVNGVGPKAGQGILGAMTTSDLRFAIYSGDSKALSKAPGIGAKTAQRIILDLKDKISIEDNLPGMTEGEIGFEKSEAGQGVYFEAVQALTALGYAKSDATRVLSSIQIDDGMTVEDILKAALKNLAFL